MAYVVWRVFMKKYSKVRLGLHRNPNAILNDVSLFCFVYRFRFCFWEHKYSHMRDLYATVQNDLLNKCIRNAARVICRMLNFQWLSWISYKASTQGIRYNASLLTKAMNMLHGICVIWWLHIFSCCITFVNIFIDHRMHTHVVQYSLCWH